MFVRGIGDGGSGGGGGLSSRWRSLLACRLFSMDALESQRGLLISSIFLTQKQEQGQTSSLHNCTQFAGEEVHKPIQRHTIRFIHAIASCIGVCRMKGHQGDEALSRKWDRAGTCKQIYVGP